MNEVYKFGVVQLYIRMGSKVVGTRWPINQALSPECSAELHSVLSGPWVAYIFITRCNTGLCNGAYIKKANTKNRWVALLVTDAPCDLRMEVRPVSKLVIWN